MEGYIFGCLPLKYLGEEEVAGRNDTVEGREAKIGKIFFLKATI